MDWKRILIALAVPAAFAAGYFIGASGNDRYQFERDENHSLYIFDTRTGTVNIRSILGTAVHRFERHQPPGEQIRLDPPKKPTEE